MTFKELATAILALPPDGQNQTAGVWASEGVPATEFVPLTGIGNMGFPSQSPTQAPIPVLLTGKSPPVIE